MNSFLYRHRVVLLHVAFWCVYSSFFFYRISSRDRELDWEVAFLRAGFHVLFNMAAAYLNYFIFLPRFLERRKVGRYLLEYAVPFALLIFVRVHLQRYIADGYTYTEGFYYSNIYLVQIVATSLFVVIFVGMLRFAEDWFELEARKKEIENEKLTAELGFLKEQINPHFLFNTLNNLYYLAYTKSENTTEVIAKLSQMMRYMIYESNHPQVPMSKEVEYMQNYISLERLRLNNQIPIQFNVSGDTVEAKIAPLILITFLENAFKHGVDANNPESWVKVCIQLDGNICRYMVENSKTKHVTSEPVEKSGIGLRNVMRRLELSYPNRFDIKVQDEPDRYKVDLKLELT
jgi:two-component system, LytTR family, sensor histidine kinase AlgZ